MKGWTITAIAGVDVQHMEFAEVMEVLQRFVKTLPESKES